MKTNFLTLVLCLIGLQSFSQDSLLPPISAQDFYSDSKLIDSTAHAIVILEKGLSDIQVVEADRALRVIHRYAVRIKILDREGFVHANQTVPLYKIGGTFEYLRDISARTHHLHGGKISTQEIDRKAIFSEKATEYVSLTKFTLPNIKEEAIIDIEYTVYSPDIFNYRTWDFQTDIPKVHSEYTAIIPAVYQYGVTLRGVRQLSEEVKGELLKDYFLLAGRRFDCSKLRYIMRDIPAFKEEKYMLAAKNYKSAIYFELEQYYNINGAKHAITKEWKNVDTELLNDKDFGKQLSRASAFKDILPPLLANLSTEEEKARVIYDYIKKNIRWNKYYGKYSQHGVKDLLEQRSGNTGDINLALIAAMNAAKLECYPIIISTRENGLPNAIHPVITDFNYVIAALKINDKTFFLDATEKYLPFGELPLRCINGNGRIIYSKKSSEWVELRNDRPALTSYTITGAIDDNGLFEGEITIAYAGLDALHQRNHIASFPSTEEYVEHKIENFSGFAIQDGQVEHLEDLDKQLVEKLQVSIDYKEGIQSGNFRLNPILIDRTTQNPFNLQERNYPVDLGAKRTERHSINIQLPAGYQIIDFPKNLRMALPESTAQYSYISSFSGNRLALNQTLQLNKAAYSVDEYFHLKEFYSRIIQHQKIDFLFTKKP